MNLLNHVIVGLLVLSSVTLMGHVKEVPKLRKGSLCHGDAAE